MDIKALPELYSPFPSRINRHADAVHESTVEWLENFGIFQDEVARRRFHATRIGRLAARFHPDASLDALRLVSYWYGWMFLWDDQRDESELGMQPDLLTTTNARFIAILAGARPERCETPLAHALWDLRSRVLERAPNEEWMARLVGSIGEHFGSTVWEATNRSRGITPDLASYVSMRPATGGLNVDTQFIEIAERAYLPVEIHTQPTLQVLMRTSNNSVCWANDIFSLQKEIERNDVHNLVLVLQRAEDLELAAAIDRAVEMHDAEVRAFVGAASRLGSLATPTDENVERFVEVLKTRMRGFIDWANESGRYRASAEVARSAVEERS